MFRSTAIVPLGLLALVYTACATDPPAAVPEIDAGVSDAADAAPEPYPILPYPPGPYGGAVGDVLPDFSIQGYALSRTQRDVTKLPFRNISLAEVRSEPACTCVIIVRNAAGIACPPCRELERALIPLLTADPKLCAMETFDFNFDAATKAQPEGLVTRSDVEDLAEINRPNFAVGLLTKAANLALTAETITAFPSFYFVRKSDMRLLGFEIGLYSDVKTTVNTACASAPANAPQAIATGISPRKLVIDQPNAFVSDWIAGVLSIPLAGGTPTTIAKPASTPDAIAVSPTHVYWSTHDGGTSFEIGRAPKGGGAKETLATSTSGFTSLAVDATSVYFTRADGVVGSIPLSGGPITALASGEKDPSSIVIDDTEAFWIGESSTQILRTPKAGGARIKIADGKGFQAVDRILNVVFRDLLLRGADVVTGISDGRRPSAIARFAKDASTTPEFDVDWGFLSAMASEPSGRIAIASSSANIENLGTVGLVVPKRSPIVLALGQRNVSGVGGDGAKVYWITNEDDVTASRGALRAANTPPIGP